MSKHAISWIHLSDTHFRKTNNISAWDQEIVLRSLISDIRDQIQEIGTQPDFILFSGDVAFSGQADEYALARNFFDELLATAKLAKNRLFVVPGNHDINRDAVTPMMKAAAQTILNTKNRQDFRRATNDLLDRPEDRALIFKRLQAYGEFVNDYLGGHIQYSDQQPSYMHKLDVAGKQVAILGFCSPWLCEGDEDRNHILLGERTVRTLLDQAKNADLTVAMIHHPFEWLHDFDRDDVEPLVTKQCDFIVHGHLHRTGIEKHITPDIEAMVIGAGASYEERENTNVYNIVCLNLSTGQGKIVLRRYSDEKGGFWSRDTLTYRSVNTGEFIFSLPDKLRLISLGAEPRSGESSASAQNHSQLIDWPVFETDPNFARLMAVRLQFIESELRKVIARLSANSSRYSAYGRLSNYANYLIQHDIVNLRKLQQNELPISQISRTLLFDTERDVDALLSEYLDLQSGLMLCREEESQETCTWGDALLQEIGNRMGEGWKGMCVIANSAIAGLISNLVRLSFPNENIWTLPLAVHQYATLLPITQRAGDLMKFTEPKDARILSILTADILATHLCGPAYVFAALVVWHNPIHPRGGSHYSMVSFGQRFNYMIKTLEHSNDSYTPEIAVLKKIWIEKHIQEDNTDDGSNGEDYLKNFDDLHKQIVSYTYGTAMDHQQHKLFAKQIVDAYEHKGIGEVSDRICLIDILNAAWYSRIQIGNPEELKSMTAFYWDLFRKRMVES